MAEETIKNEEVVGSTNNEVDKIHSKTSQKDVVEVPKTAFDEMMARLAALEKAQKEVEAAQDQKTASKIEQMRKDGKLVKDVKVRRLENSLVIGWRTVSDDVYFADGKLIEKQEVEVWLDGGAKKILTMRQWATLPVYEKMEVKKESRDENGEIVYGLLGSDGKEVEINVKYIN